MFVFPSCRGRGLMNREEMIESMACEDRVRELRRQGQRLQQRLLAAHDTVFICGPADVQVGMEADGTVTAVPLAKRFVAAYFQ
jgi:hypothetical protein